MTSGVAVQNSANIRGRIGKRVLVGFLIAPLTPGVLLEAARLLPLFHSAAGMTVVFLSYPVAWLLGVPAYLLFERFSLRCLWHYALAGYLFMQACAWLLVISYRERDEPDFSYIGWAEYSTMMGVLCAATTAVFWTIAVRMPSRRGAKTDSDAASGVREQ